MQQGSGPISTSTPVAGSEAELNSLNNSNTFGDGEVTPGNSDTKATFKNDEDVENENRTDSSSFDDDLETISQDNEDGEQDRRNRQKQQQKRMHKKVRHHNLKPLLLNLVKLKKETATIQIRVSYTQNSNKTRKKKKLFRLLVHQKYLNVHQRNCLYQEQQPMIR